MDLAACDGQNYPRQPNTSNFTFHFVLKRMFALSHSAVACVHILCMGRHTHTRNKVCLYLFHSHHMAGKDFGFYHCSRYRVLLNFLILCVSLYCVFSLLMPARMRFTVCGAVYVCPSEWPKIHKLRKPIPFWLYSKKGHFGDTINCCLHWILPHY